MAVVLCFGGSYGVAAAQTQPSLATSPSPAADIVVTGQREADKNAIEAKRAAPRIMDVLSADDIGAMADFSIGDALKRIAGVNTYNYQGEPRFASIRGFNSNYITTTLDGLQISSPDNQNQNNGGGRQFYLESLPSNIASRIEVVKSSTPDMPGHSVGGSVNFAIPSAFDFRENQTRVSAKGGLEIQDPSKGGNRPTYEGEAFLTRRFGAGDQFGLMLSGSYWRRDQWIADAEQGSTDYWYNSAGKNTGTPYSGGAAVGNQRAWMLYDDSRERGSVLGKLDWRPDSRLSASLTGFWFTQHETAIRHDTLASIGANAVNSNQSGEAGTLSPGTTASNIASSVRTYALYFERRTWGTQGNIKYQIADDLKAEVRGAYSRATFSNPQISDTFVQNGLSYNYQTTPDGVYLTPVNSAAYNNMAAYGPDTHFVEKYTTSANHYEGQARLAWHMDPHDRGLGVEMGASFIRNTHDESYDQTTWSNLPFNLNSVVSGTRLCSNNCNNGGMFLIDPGALQNELNQTLSSVTPVINTATHYKDSFGIVEDVTSAYVMARYVGQNWSVIGGLRLEHTNFSTYGYEALTTLVGGTSKVSYPQVTAVSHYDHWLPSLNAQYDLRSDMLLRAAYSRTIGRPKFTDMGLLGGSLNASDPNNPVLSKGNPDLRPRMSDNFDLSYEWYFDKHNGLFSIAGFHKTVKHEIYLIGQSGLIDEGNGISAMGTITTPVNSKSLTTVDGVEFNLVKYFTFLPGVFSNFGINANAMFSKAHFPIQLQDGTNVVLPSLPNSARQVTNLAVFYEGKKLHARLAWNHTGWFIEDRFIGSATNAATLYRIRWSLPEDFVDASLSYDINAKLTVRLDGTNLTGQGSDDNMGLSREIAVARYRMPSAVMVGASYKF